MISNHVTYFILFHWSDIFFVTFLSFPSFISIRVVTGIPECFLACVNSSSKFLMDYIGVYFVWFYLWGGVCFLERREVRAPCPSLSVPSLAVPGATISVKSIGRVPVLHSLVWLVPVSMCSLVHHALLRSISLALTVLLWAGENKQKGYQLFRKKETGFPQLIFCVVFKHCLFLNAVWFGHTQSKTEKRVSGAFISFAFRFLLVGLSLISFLF